MALRNYDNDELRRLDVAHHLPPQQDWGLSRDVGGSKIITRAKGSTIYDAEGNAILDAMAGLWCVQVGYGREELADVARDQIVELAYYNSFFKTTTPPTVKLAAKVASLLGADLQHVFFNSSGSEAVDTALRIARHYWQVKGEPQRTVIIGRKNGYHGSTIGGVSMGGMERMHKQGGPWVPDIEHALQPYRFVEGFGEDPETFAKRAADSIEERILAVGPERVAMIFGEPIQGAGGVVIPHPTYWPRVEAIARKYGVLLGSDEVICGFGRVGRWFAFQHFGVKPDIVTMAKGLSSGYLPISAVGVADEVVETIRGSGSPFVHGYTYSGHPVAAAVALANLEIMERENLVERTAKDTGPYLAEALQRLADKPMVGEVRSLGLLGALEIVGKKGTNERFPGKEGSVGEMVRDICAERGVMVRNVRDAIVMSPPLVITREEIDKVVDTLGEALEICAERAAALAS